MRSENRSSFNAMIATLDEKIQSLLLLNSKQRDSTTISTFDTPLSLPPATGVITPRDPKMKPINIIKRNIANGKPTLVAGPMVRYSKLPFRATVRHFGCDIVYSPMILAREFVRNDVARLSDFTTNSNDTSLIVQVGVNNELDMIRFVDMIHPYVDGIGLNCGCPIKEQVAEGIGAALMSEPELVSRMVKVVKDKYHDEVCIDVKIRIHSDLEVTKRFMQMVEASGADFITIHGRTKNTRSSVAVNLDAIKYLRKCVQIPVISNGDCFKPGDINKIIDYTGCDGVMAVRGILENPAIFAGYEKTPWLAVELFWHYALSYGIPFRITQHHLSQMLGKCLTNSKLKEMNLKDNMMDLIDWFDDNFMLKRQGEEGFATAVEVPYK